MVFLKMPFFMPGCLTGYSHSNLSILLHYPETCRTWVEKKKNHKKIHSKCNSVLSSLFSWGAINVSSAEGKSAGSSAGWHKKQCNSVSLQGTHPLTPTLTAHNSIALFLLLPNSLALDTEPPGLLYRTHSFSRVFNLSRRIVLHLPDWFLWHFQA